MYAPRYGKARDAVRRRMRGVPGHGRHLGSSSLVQELRTRGVLSRFEKSPCAQAFLEDPARDHFVIRARRRLELVLRRRYPGVLDMTTEAGDLGIADGPAFIGRRAQMV